MGSRAPGGMLVTFASVPKSLLRVTCTFISSSSSQTQHWKNTGFASSTSDVTREIPTIWKDTVRGSPELFRISENHPKNFKKPLKFSTIFVLVDFTYSFIHKLTKKKKKLEEPVSLRGSPELFPRLGKITWRLPKFNLDLPKIYALFYQQEPREDEVQEPYRFQRVNRKKGNKLLWNNVEQDNFFFKPKQQQQKMQAVVISLVNRATQIRVPYRTRADPGSFGRGGGGRTLLDMSKLFTANNFYPTSI